MTGVECGYRHETFAQFLQFVGVGSETAREDACRMEHIVSEETVRQVCSFAVYGSELSVCTWRLCFFDGDLLYGKNVSPQVRAGIS